MHIQIFFYISEYKSSVERVHKGLNKSTERVCKYVRYIFLKQGGAISWRSRKQIVVEKSYT